MKHKNDCPLFNILGLKFPLKKEKKNSRPLYSSIRSPNTQGPLKNDRITVVPVLSNNVIGIWLFKDEEGRVLEVKKKQ